MYVGDSKVYLPIVHDAIEARVTRYSNSIFPMTGRYSDVLSNDAKVPYETMAILDHYVEQTSLRDIVVPTLMRAGDISGQYSLYISWLNRNRYTIKKKQTPPIEGINIGDAIDDIDTETVNDSRPDVLVLDSRDLLVLPASVDEIDDADIVCIALRKSKGAIQQMIDDGEIDEDAGEELLDNMANPDATKQPNPDKKALGGAGIQTDSKGNKTVVIYQIWTKLKIGGKRRRVMAYMNGQENILSCKRNPYWSDRVPVISQAASKVNGSFWGKSKVIGVETIAYAANDAWNMGQDSMKYSLMPVVCVDPEKFQRVSSIILEMGSIWLGDPSTMKIQQFPDVWPAAERVVEKCSSLIMQSLGTNPAMVPMLNSGKKPSQAQISQEQQVSIETTSDVVTILETSILNKVLRWFYELDYQFRTKDVHVRRFGPVGIQAEMQAVPPIGVDTHLTIHWYGTEGNKSAQQIQQMISFLGTLKQIPPDQMAGRVVDAGPIIEQASNSIFGPRVAPRVLIDKSHENTVPPEVENTMLAEGFSVLTSPADNVNQHIMSHRQAAIISGDPTGSIRAHIHMHEMDQAKIQQERQPQGGINRAGSQVQPPTGPQAPAGAVHPDNMPLAAPRPAR